MLAANPNRQLGRLRPKSRPKALRFGEYLDPAAVNLPVSTNRRAASVAVMERMLCNDTLGCCVISDWGHLYGLVSGAAGSPLITATDAEIKAAYRVFSPAPFDRGCNISDTLDYGETTGFKFGGKVRKTAGYVAVNYTNKDLLRAAIYILGSVKIGMDLCEEWYESDDGAIWDVNNSRILSGHDVLGIDYDDDGIFIATWGGYKRKITWAAMAGGAIDETYAPLLPEWIGANGLAASNLDLPTLTADLAKIGGGTIPPIVVPAIDWSNVA